MASPARGRVVISVEECKGCGLCVDACPPKCLLLAPELSAGGVHPALYIGQGCTGCGICFFCCPEPGAITVYRLVPKRPDEVARAAGSEASGSRPLPREPLALALDVAAAGRPICASSVKVM